MDYEEKIVADIIRNNLSRFSYNASDEAINNAASDIVDYYNEVFESMGAYYNADN